VIARRHDELVPVPTDDPGIFVDIDRPGDLVPSAGNASSAERKN
jgi:hypothetical protein